MRTIEMLESRRLLSAPVAVNFQPAGVPVPAGYVADTGEVYGPRASGLTYGWSADNTAAARDRNAARSPGQAHDTLTSFGGPDLTWEVALPVGRYDVRLVAGDPAAFDGAHKLRVEGALAIDAGLSSAHPWVAGRVTVDVTDGRLTLAPEADAVAAKVNFIEIRPTPAVPPAVGDGSGLVATYYDQRQFAVPVLSRVDPTLNFNWGTRPPVSGVAPTYYAVRWSGQIQAQHAEEYALHLLADDGVRMWVDGAPVIDAFHDRATAAEHTAVVPMQAGRKYDIRIDYFQSVGAASARLMWSSPSTPKQLVPATQLYAAPVDLAKHLGEAWALADAQLRRTAGVTLAGRDDTYVQHTRDTGEWTTVDVNHWTVGSLPGALWRMHARTGDAFHRDQATARTLPLAGQRYRQDDVTFRVYNAFRPLYDLTGDPQYRQVLIDSAASRVAMYDATVGAFQTTWRRSSSGDPRANFGVLLDQTMDLQTIFWAARETNNQDWYDKAVRHARTVAAHLVRADGGTFHWGYFDRATGAFVSGETYQGYSHTSTWARGQAWAIYGFAVAYRETGLIEFLDTARKLVAYWTRNPTPDNVPYWDFDAPKTPTTFRDTSAAAIAASAMLDLADLDPANRAAYRATAGRALLSLASRPYLAAGSTSHGILNHGALNVPANRGTRASLIFGDYYFLEAMTRYGGA